MANEIFADGIGEIGFGGGAIRVDYYSLSHNETDASGNPKREVRQRVIMTPRGFLEAFATMQGMINKLVESGVLQRNPAAVPGADLAAAVPPPGRSGNF